jgi:SulP family sulfate permease
MTNTHHAPNKELIGQGLGNLVAAFFGGIPGAGATACTVVNIKAGGHSRVSGVINVLFLVLIFLFGGGIVAYIPRAVLGGVLVTIGIIIMDTKALKQIRIIPRMDTVIMLTVVILTVFNELLYAVMIGLAMASIHFMKKMADVVELDSQNANVDRLVDKLFDTFGNSDEFRKNVLVKNIKGPIFFGFASRFLKGMDAAGDMKAIVFNLGSVPYIDQSGVYTIEKTIRSLRQKDILVVLSELSIENEKLLKGVGIIPELVEERLIFGSVEESVMWLEEPGNLEGEIDDKQLVIPSAYTPNGDGINDDWELKNIDQYPDCVVKIYDKSTRLVFESKGYQTMWSGEFEGTMLPNDTYSYQIDLYGNGKDVREGTVSIFR